jgi:hypothetical protein
MSNAILSIYIYHKGAKLNVGEHVSECVKITITITVTVTTIIVNMMQGIWQSGGNPPCGNAVQQQKNISTLMFSHKQNL